MQLDISKITLLFPCKSTHQITMTHYSPRGIACQNHTITILLFYLLLLTFSDFQFRIVGILKTAPASTITLNY